MISQEFTSRALTIVQQRHGVYYRSRFSSYRDALYSAAPRHDFMRWLNDRRNSFIQDNTSAIA